MKILKEKNIFYLHQYFHFPDEPGSIRSFTISDFFVKKGYKVIVLSLNSNSKYKFIRKKNNITCIYIPIRYSNETPYILRIIIFAMYTLISSFFALLVPSKLIYCSSTPLSVAIGPLIVSYISKKKFLFEVRDVWPEVPIELGFIRNKLIKKLLKLFEILVYKKSLAVITLSPDMKKLISKKLNYKKNLGNYKKKKILLIPNFSEHKIFDSAKLVRWQKNNLLNQADYLNLKKLELWKNNSNIPVIIYAGTMGFVNNPYLFIDLIKLINNFPKVRLLLCITGSYKNKVIQEIKNKRYFYEFPYSSKVVLPYIYQYADCGISFVRSIKCLFANSANKYFDCLASGKPLIINHFGWQHDELQKNKCGFYLDHQNLYESYMNLANSLNDENLIDEMSKNAYDLSKKYNSDKLLYKLKEYL